MKKLLSLFTLFVAVLGLAACGSKEPDVKMDTKYESAAYEEKEGMGGRVFFGFDSDALSAEADKTISMVAMKLMNYPKREVTLYAYADSIGDKGYNKKLADRRAHAVRMGLIEHGVEKDRIKIEVRGSKDSEMNVSKKEGSFDRRVDIFIRD